MRRLNIKALYARIILFCILSLATLSLSIDEAINLYRVSSSSREIDLKRENYHKSYLEYRREDVFKLHITDSGTGPTHLFHKSKACLGYVWRSSIRPSMKLFFFDLSLNIRNDYNIATSDFTFLIDEIDFNIDFIDAFYYSDSKYSRDMSYLTYKQNEITSKLEDLNNIEKIIDIYTSIQTMQEKLEVMRISLDQLKQDEAFLIDREKIGNASRMDIERVRIEIGSVELNISTLERSIEINMRNLCMKIGILYDPNIELLSFTTESREVIVNEMDLELLENQKEIQYVNDKLHFRRKLPKLGLSLAVTLDHNEEVSKEQYMVNFSWDLAGNKSEYLNAKRDRELLKISLENSKINMDIKLSEAKNEYEELVSSLYNANRSRDYWREISEIKREMYKKGHISFQDYMQYYSRLREQEALLSEIDHRLEGFKKKLEFVHEFKSKKTI